MLQHAPTGATEREHSWAAARRSTCERLATCTSLGTRLGCDVVGAGGPGDIQGLGRVHAIGTATCIANHFALRDTAFAAAVVAVHRFNAQRIVCVEARNIALCSHIAVAGSRCAIIHAAANGETTVHVIHHRLSSSARRFTPARAGLQRTVKV